MGARQSHRAADRHVAVRLRNNRRTGTWAAVSTCVALMAVAGVLLIAFWPLLSVQLIGGSPRMVGPSHDAKKFPTVNAVSGIPSDWIATVCKPHALYPAGDVARFPANALFAYPNTTFDLPRALYSAVCPARYDGASDPVILLAEYRTEDTMQLELADNNIKWYCFAANHGHLLVMGTRAEESAVNPYGFAGSPVLMPLETFGFNVYEHPGPSFN
jgi:hypothetical protein